MLIIYALNPALAVGRQHDPFFEHLFPDVHGEMELPDLDDVDDAPTHSSDPMGEFVGWVETRQ
jgi:hypothetical protein